MVGHMSKGIYPPRVHTVDGPPAITLTNVSAGTRLAPLSVTVRQGEVVGIAGLKGAGGERLLVTVAGVEQPSGGEISIGSEALRRLLAVRRLVQPWGRRRCCCRTP